MATGLSIQLTPAYEPAAERALLNALTVDVEDYYHVSGFEGCVDRARWDEFPSRVGPNTRRLLDLLAAAGVRAPFWGRTACVGRPAGCGSSRRRCGRCSATRCRSAAAATSGSTPTA